MTIQKILANAAGKIVSPTARLDSEILLAFLVKQDRSWLHVHADDEIDQKMQDRFEELVLERMTGTPVAYLTGVKEFYGREFNVTQDVLVPRPESESFIELLKHLKSHNQTPFLQGLTLRQGEALQNGRSTEGNDVNNVDGFLHQVLDMGTGSGCLAITAKLEFPDMLVTATDTSTDALKVAITNAQEYDASIIFKEQSLLTGDKIGYDIILANLPYVPVAMQDPSIMREPQEALFSGIDGLDHYRRLFEQLEPKHIRFVITESLLIQHAAMITLAEKAGYTPTKTDGLVQLFTKTNY